MLPSVSEVVPHLHMPSVNEVVSHLHVLSVNEVVPHMHVLSVNVIKTKSEHNFGVVYLSLQENEKVTLACRSL